MNNQQLSLPAVPNSTMAIVSLVSGILGWTLLPFFGSIAAIYSGYKAKRQIGDSNGQLGGNGMATVGLVLGYTSLGLILVTCVAVAAITALGMFSQR